MREIKFRAYNKEDKQWQPVYLDFDGWFIYDLDIGTKIYVDEVYESTGRKDKNGKDIYKGNIVRKEKDECLGEEETGLVVWSKGWPMFTVSQITGQFDGESFEHSEGINFVWEELEIIGDSIENPELLK